MTTFGNKIKEARLKAKMTQEDLAKETGVKASAIGNYETDYRDPNIETIKSY